MGILSGKKDTTPTERLLCWSSKNNENMKDTILGECLALASWKSHSSVMYSGSIWTLVTFIKHWFFLNSETLRFHRDPLQFGA